MNIATTRPGVGTITTAADSTRRLSLITGIFFLLTFAHVAIFPFYDGVLNDSNFILGAGDATGVRLGALFEAIVVIANVATGVILFQVLRLQQPAIALGYVAVRVFESTVIAVGTMCLLAIVTLREGGQAAAVDPATLVSIGKSLVAVRDWTFFFGPGLCAGFGNGVLLGYLMYRSGIVPRKMALLGLVGGPLSIVGLVFVLFGAWGQDAPAQLLFTIVEIAWELSLSIFLIVKGFNRGPITDAFMRISAAQPPRLPTDPAGAE